MAGLAGLCFSPSDFYCMSGEAWKESVGVGVELIPTVTGQGKCVVIMRPELEGWSPPGWVVPKPRGGFA